MKVLLGKIINSKEVLIKIGNSSAYDAVTAYTVARNISLLNIELETFDKSRIELIKKYGEEQDDGNTSVLKDKIPEYNRELSELLNLEIEINITMINPEKLTGLTPFDMMAIDWMLELNE